MTKSDLMRKMHRAGLRLDAAALAAQIAVNAVTDERNRIIVCIRSVLSVRQVSRLLGISKTQIARLFPNKDDERSRKERERRLSVIRAELEIQRRGYSTRAAKVLGMDPKTVRDIAKRAGLVEKAQVSHCVRTDGTAPHCTLHATADG